MVMGIRRSSKLDFLENIPDCISDNYELHVYTNRVENVHEGEIIMILTVGSSVKDDENRAYVLDEIIGQGGFGYVFKAHRKSDNSIFAVKTMLPSFGDLSAEEAFKNEIQSAARVKSENIIRYEFVHNGDNFPELPPYIIMEYADGGTLGSILKQRRQASEAFELFALLDIFKQLTNGMSEINRTLVHRDIKPDNILLCGNTLKISDFGLSKIAAENTRTMTFKGGGTPLYMAPEAWDFSKNTIQMDIYSMGIVFYELATLRYPYEPIPRTLEDCKNAHLLSAMVSLEKANTSLPSSLISVINRMLEKSTKRRFPNWQDIIQLLENQTEPDSPIDKMVAMAVAAKNAKDIARQNQESAAQQKAQEKSDFCKLVYSQFESTITAPIVSFVEKVNSQYAGSAKITFPQSGYTTYSREHFSWKMNIPPNNSLTINMEAILKENYKREVPVDRIWGENRTRTEHYIPQYKGKNILAWGEVSNQAGYGFNLLLLDSGEIYGDWIIMNNKNNFSNIAGTKRREPFSFSLQELPKEINSVQVTHWYSADFEPFSDTSFLSLVRMLAFDLG